jgi:hypothetical protein
MSKALERLQLKRDSIDSLLNLLWALDIRSIALWMYSNISHTDTIAYIERIGTKNGV